MKIFPLLNLLLLASAPVTLSAQDDYAQRLDGIFQTWSKPGTPGAAVAVIQHGKLVFEKSYGLANLEYDVPVTPKGHKLKADHVRHGEITLLSKGQDKFTTTEWFMPEVNFLRDSSNRVSAVTPGGGRVAGIRSTRKDSPPAPAPKS